MSYAPALPTTGYAGWILLGKTMDRQQAAFNKSPEIKSNEQYFKENIGKVNTVDDLMSDYRLLKVTLSAFGLEDDINNKYFIRKVLTEGTSDSASLANKLSDKSYLKLSAAFGFADYEIPLTQQSSFADEILSSYKSRQFEVAVGDVDQSYRIALTAERELPELASSSSSENTKWYSIIASESLSTFMKSALGLPDEISNLNVDKQVSIFKQKFLSVFGTKTISEAIDNQGMNKLIKNYLIKSQIIGSASAVENSTALDILQGSKVNVSGNSILSILL